MLQLKWFKIETGADGSILACEEVAAKGRAGAVVRYYEAATKAEACSQAKAWADAWRASNVERSRKVHAARVANKLCCRCGKVHVRFGRRNCLKCRVIMAAAESARLHAKRAGLPPPNPRKFLTDEQLRERARAACKKSAYAVGGSLCRTTILRKFDELGPVQFRTWLICGINEYRAARPEYAPPQEAQAAE